MLNAPLYRQRRAGLAQALRDAGGGVAIVPTAPQRQRNSDGDHPYRFDSHFHYLTGFAEPDSWLVLTSDGRSVLFCQAKDIEREIWDGLRLGPNDAPAVLGVDESFSVETLDDHLPVLLGDQSAVWLPMEAADLHTRVRGWLDRVRGRARIGITCPGSLRDLTPLLGEMRLLKDEAEIATLRRVAAGANACVLHYAAGNAELRTGELCLIDAGCELDGYASDITRTFPASGRFSGPQRALYDIVLAAQEAAIAVTRPGARKQDAHWAAVRVLAQGMLDVGLLDRAVHGDVDAVIDSAAYRQFYMHGTGHWLGLDVHDVGEYLALEEPPVEQPDALGGTVVRKPSRVLQPGMVVTIEPGLYVRPAEGVPEQFWHIGIRIEDDALVTADGCELMSRGVPVRADEIEALMRER